MQSFLEQCRKDLRRLRVAWIEVKVGPGRLVTYNPTGYQFKVEFHVDTKPPLPYPVLNRIQRKRMYAQVSESHPSQRHPASFKHHPAS